MLFFLSKGTNCAMQYYWQVYGTLHHTNFDNGLNFIKLCEKDQINKTEPSK